MRHQPPSFFATLLISIISLLTLTTACTIVRPDTQYVYEPTANPLNKVVRAQSEALEQGKLLLVVLGAQWCHDSTGLAKRFSSSDMQRILQPHYFTVFVDVGMLEDRRDITQRFDYPNYYATPTVMIIDPASSALLNRASMDIWGRADSIPLSQYVDYFSAFATMTTKQKAPLLAWQSTPQETQYYAEQALRLQEAYRTLGPMLQSDINGNTPEGFYDLWREAKAFRSALQKTMAKRASLTIEKDNGQARFTYN